MDSKRKIFVRSSFIISTISCFTSGCSAKNAFFGWKISSVEPIRRTCLGHPTDRKIEKRKKEMRKKPQHPGRI